MSAPTNEGPPAVLYHAIRLHAAGRLLEAVRAYEIALEWARSNGDHELVADVEAALREIGSRGRDQ